MFSTFLVSLLCPQTGNRSNGKLHLEAHELNSLSELHVLKCLEMKSFWKGEIKFNLHVVTSLGLIFICRQLKLIHSNPFGWFYVVWKCGKWDEKQSFTQNRNSANVMECFECYAIYWNNRNFIYLLVVATKRMHWFQLMGLVAGFNLHKSDKNRITGGENVASETMSRFFRFFFVFGWFWFGQSW